MNPIQIPDGIIIAILTFLLGLVSAAYGVQIGKSFEARKELLEKMRDWVDRVVLNITADYVTEVFDRKASQQSDENQFGFSIQKTRWLGIVEGFRDFALSKALDEFIVAVESFDAYYLRVEKYSPDREEKRKQALSELAKKVDQTARNVHKVITQEAIRVPFWMTRPHWKLRLSRRWIFIFIALVVIGLVVWFLTR